MGSIKRLLLNQSTQVRVASSTASARRSVYLIATYWLPRSLWWTSPAAMGGPALIQSLFKSIEDETGMGRSADPPADDVSGENADDEGDINETLSG
jgi:hypothetical protein